MRRSNRWLKAAAVLCAFTLIATACGDGETADGQTVTLLHAISGTEEQAALQTMLDAFQTATGHTVQTEFSTDFAQDITLRVEGNNPPDVALYPSPGALQAIVDDDGVRSFADAGISLDGLIPGMVETGTFDGEAYGVVVKLGVKSLVWYPKAAFDAAGYAVPETWDDLVDLTRTIAATGTPAWCVGVESGGDTGWPLTDWVEDIMLRLHGPDVYDQWVANEVAFTSPEVREAFETLEEIWLEPGHVVGGATGITNISFLDAPAPMFQDPSGCFFHKQAGFIEAEFPEELELGVDYDVFFLPPIDPAVGNGALFAGDLAAVHTDNSAAAELIEFMVSREGQEAWHGHAGSGGLAVRTDFDASVYPSDSLATQGALLTDADFARFDGGDLMPPAVGAGAFFTEPVNWVNGDQDLDTTLANIEAAWPGG